MGSDTTPGVAGGFIFVTPDWVHVDLIVHRVEGFDKDTCAAHVLFDRSGLVTELLPTDELWPREPYEPDVTPHTFLYSMGNLVTVAHRGEWLALAQHAIAREYILRSKRLAGRRGMDWPADLEAAVRALWQRVLGINLK